MGERCRRVRCREVANLLLPTSTTSLWLRHCSPANEALHVATLCATCRGALIGR